MTWMKVLALLVSVSMLASPVPAYAHGLAAQAAVDDFAEYAAREAQSADLESFTGGFHGVVIGLFVLFVVVWLVVEICSPATVHIEHRHRHHGHGPVHP